jgi:hypothetical protein
MVWKFTDTVKRNWGFLGAESGVQLPLLTFFHIPAKYTEEGLLQCEDISVSVNVKCRLLH